MTTFSYTTGNPNNLVGGATASMNDIQGPFTDLKTFLNSGNIDATNVTHAVFGGYRTVQQACWGIGNDAVAGNYIPKGEGLLIGNSANIGLAGPFPVIIRIDPADYTISGLSAKMRVSGAMYTNATAPAINFTWGLYPVSAVGGAADNLALTASVTAVSGSTFTRTAPALSSAFSDASSDFDPPTAGQYVLMLTTSGTIANNSLVAGSVRLEFRYI